MDYPFAVLKKLLVACSLLVLPIFAACSSNNSVSPVPTNTIPTEEEDGLERARGQARNFLGAYLSGYARASAEGGQSIYAGGLTPAQVLDCMIKKFEMALDAIDTSVTFMDKSDFDDQVPDETKHAWVKICATVDPAAPNALAPFNIKGFKIQVANATGMPGNAGDMTIKLQDQGYVMQLAMNSAAGTVKRTKTGVFYLAGCEAASQNVAAVLGGNVEVAPMPQPIPVENGTVGEACILILLGTDLANKPLAGVVGGRSDSAATTTTVAG